MNTLVFRYSFQRCLRNLIFLLPLAAFAVTLHFLKLGTPALYILFGVIALLWLVGSLSPLVRFRVTLQTGGDQPQLDCRGSVLHRCLKLADISKLEICKRREKTPRWFRAQPYRVLVLYNPGKRLVLSSLSLGDEAFDQLTEALKSALPESAL